MLQSRHQVVITLLFFFDIVLSGVIWEVAYQARFYWIDFPIAFHIPDHRYYFRALPIVCLLTGIIFILSGLYRSEWVAQIKPQLPHLIKACLLLFVSLVAIAFFYRKFSYSRIHVIYYILIFSSCLLLVRYALRVIVQAMYDREINTRNVLIIGASANAWEFAHTLSSHSSFGLICKGIIPIKESNPTPLIQMPIYALEKLREIIATEQIQQVYLCLKTNEYSELPILKELLKDQMVDVRIIPDFDPFFSLRSSVELLEDTPVISLVQSPLQGWNLVYKRMLDFWGALLAIFLFSPVMLVICVLIKITSRGPILYAQERMGFDGMIFPTLKFRSMKVDAEKETGAVWAAAEDDRRTAIGEFLRKTSLDELPQLFNVLVGHMSLVGPRPERPVFIEEFKHQIPNYMLRHKIKAGMTGWAQINGWRGNTSLEKRIESDLYYIANWSIWFDIRILFITLFKGFSNKNAY